MDLYYNIFAELTGSFERNSFVEETVNISFSMSLTMHLAAIFDTAIKKMQTELDEARQAIDSHMAARGTSFESIFREFLKKYLPPSLDVSTGFLVDSNGNQSRQLDIIISDAAHTPIFFSKETIRVVPIECAYAAIEVKASIDK